MKNKIIFVHVALFLSCSTELCFGMRLREIIPIKTDEMLQLIKNSDISKKNECEACFRTLAEGGRNNYQISFGGNLRTTRATENHGAGGLTHGNDALSLRFVYHGTPRPVVFVTTPINHP